jgi:pyocin large subunit-like protein
MLFVFLDAITVRSIWHSNANPNVAKPVTTGVGDTGRRGGPIIQYFAHREAMIASDKARVTRKLKTIQEEREGGPLSRGRRIHRGSCQRHQAA